MTYKLIGADRKEYGPVAAEQLRQWLAEGRVNGQTSVLAEGATEWKPLADYPEFAQALAAQTGAPPLTRAPAPPINLAAWTTEILARQPSLQIGRCLSRGWDLVKDNFGLLYGATAVVWLVSLCQFIPFAGFIYWILSGVLYGGLYMIFLKRIRGEPAAASEVLDGFKTNFAQLLLAGVIGSLLGSIGLFCCCVLPGVYLLIAWKFGVPLVADKRMEFWSALELSRKVVTRVWFQMFGLVVLAFLPFFLISLASLVEEVLLFIPFIQGVLSGGQPDLQKMVETLEPAAGRNFVLSAFTKLVLLVNLPFALAALMVAYEDLFGARPAGTT